MIVKEENKALIQWFSTLGSRSPGESLDVSLGVGKTNNLALDFRFFPATFGLILQANRTMTFFLSIVESNKICTKGGRAISSKILGVLVEKNFKDSCTRARDMYRYSF